MRIYNSIYTLFLICCYSVVNAEPPNLSSRSLSAPPHRVIRTCCAFGSDLRLMIFPFYRYNAISSADRLGPHGYLGKSGEGNGIIYTKRGGFIDLGHLRDQADWTAYLYSRILVAQEKGNLTIRLGREGGSKLLNLMVPGDLNQDDAIKLAGRIAYDLSIWHEIATWYGCSTVPFVPERYSSFSVEDPYSNLLGVTLGMEAIRNGLPYEKAMTQIIAKTMETMGAVATEHDTYMAMEAVREIWWTRTRHLPNIKIMMERQLGVYACLEPLRVPGWATSNLPSYDLHVPEKTADGRKLNNFYELDFKLNYKFPVKEIFVSKNDRRVTQEDFGTFISDIAKDVKAGRLR